MKISTKSPTRVDLSGGTLDCWPLFLLVDSCVTINLSISIFTYVDLEERKDSIVDLHMRDLKFQKSFPNLEAALAATDPELKLVQKQLAYWKPKQGFNLTTFSESPMGGGLGGSSSLSISLIKAFSKWLKQDYDLYQSVTLSSNLEAQVLHKMTGTQDYYPALQPGLNAIHFTPKGPRLETLQTDPELWNRHLTLVYTGHPHHSGLNNWQVIKAALDVEKKTLSALTDIKDISALVYKALQEKAFDRLPGLFDKEFEARVRLSSSFSSPAIERLRDVALKSGALAVKICGAGGGGCVFLWSPPDKKLSVEDACRAQGFEVLNVKAVI